MGGLIDVVYKSKILRIQNEKWASPHNTDAQASPTHLIDLAWDATRSVYVLQPFYLGRLRHHQIRHHAQVISR
ncbi:UNVERIFIED_CONTAM: hypothetical protein K2H54_076047 [Gekko kuhli]